MQSPTKIIKTGLNESRATPVKSIKERYVQVSPDSLKRNVVATVVATVDVDVDVDDNQDDRFMDALTESMKTLGIFFCDDDVVMGNT